LPSYLFSFVTNTILKLSVFIFSYDFHFFPILRILVLSSWPPCLPEFSVSFSHAYCRFILFHVVSH
jgi:hypothetical protein